MRLSLVLVALLALVGCGTSASSPTAPNQFHQTAPGSVVLLQPYSTVTLPLGTIVKPNLDPANLTPQHQAMAPFIFVNAAAGLTPLGDGTFQVTGVGRTGLFVCGAFCSSPPMPIIFLIDVNP